MNKIEKFGYGEELGCNVYMPSLVQKINELVDAVNKLQAAYEAGVKKGEER